MDAAAQRTQPAQPAQLAQPAQPAQPDQPDQPDLGILLAAAYQEFVARLHGHLAEQGYADLGSSDGFVFRALARQPMTVSELAARLEISKQGAGQIIDDMERRGYVVRSAHPDDARARLVDLAPRGRGALAAARAFHRGREERLLARHGHRAVAAARAALTDLAGPRAEGDDPRLRAGLV